jgi:hypothetical protein
MYVLMAKLSLYTHDIYSSELILIYSERNLIKIACLRALVPFPIVQGMLCPR